MRRAIVIGYRAIGLTDHVDGSNLEFIVPRIAKVAKELNRFNDITVIPGAEITHAPPGQIADLISEARELGAVIVIVHGESPVEPVAPGTNSAAIEAGADILAHPGLISREEVVLAAQRGVFLEITSRAGHSLTNGYVARMAVEIGARLVINTDTHSPDNLISLETANKVLLGAGLTNSDVKNVLQNNQDLLNTMKLRMEK